MTDLEYFIKLINNYRDDLAGRRGRIERHSFIAASDLGYMNAITEVIVDLLEITEQCKKIEELHRADVI